MDSKSNTAADADKVWQMMKDIGICMLITSQSQHVRARPMSTIVRKESNDVVMLTEKSSGKEREVEQNSNVVLNFSNGSNEFVSLHGKARRDDSRALIRHLWNPGAQAFWPKGPDDPNVEALIVQPVNAEFWAGHSGLLNSVKMAFAIATGQTPDLGENKKIAL